MAAEHFQTSSLLKFTTMRSQVVRGVCCYRNLAFQSAVCAIRDPPGSSSDDDTAARAALSPASPTEASTSLRADAHMQRHTSLEALVVSPEANSEIKFPLEQAA